jgi:hypothetical protein
MNGPKLPCEGYWKGKRCRNVAAFKHISEIGTSPPGSGRSIVVRIRLCKSCSTAMDRWLEGAMPTRAGLMRDPRRAGSAAGFYRGD